MTEQGRIEIVGSVAALRERLGAWRAAGETIGLVPTMGALHAGHLSLVDASRAENDRTCVTLFVNPKQFAPGEDLGTYPREEAEDIAKLEAAGADLLFTPDASTMYPEGFATKISIPGLGDRLEGEFRPGFFDGVATVVSKLLLQALPDTAYFGEKDFQQLRVVERLVADLDIPVAIRACAIVREADGLALSSRNAYLDRRERNAAPALHAALVAAAKRLREGAATRDAAATAEAEIIAAGFDRVDYVAICDARTLEPISEISGLGSDGARILAAAWLGRTRLIDNLATGNQEYPTA